jgi:tetratricopeptide (TPR) repeat protein
VQNLNSSSNLDDPTAVVKLAESLMAEGDVRKAIELLQPAVKRFQGDIPVLLCFGSALAMIGEIQGAIELFSAIAKEAPDSSLAWSRLGGLFLRQGKTKEAAALLQRSLSLDPHHTRVRLELAKALMDQNDFESSLLELQRVVSESPDDVDARILIGNALRGCGREVEGIQHLKVAIRLQPENPRTHHNLGTLLSALGQVDEPIKCYQTALRLKPDAWHIWVALGQLMVTLGRLEKGEKCFDIVIEHNPEHIVALAGKGSVLIRRGQYDKVIALLRSPISRGEREVNLVLVYCNACQQTGVHGEPIRILREMLALPQSKPAASMLWHTLAHHLDKAGSAKDAFYAYEQANKLRCLTFDPAHHTAATSATIRAFSRVGMSQMYSSSNIDERPVFIVGMPRSGTSLVEQILSAHSQIYGAGEREHVREIAGQIARTSGGSLSKGLINGEPASFDVGVKGFLSRLETSGRGSRFVTDKMPQNFLYLGLISRLFPGARIIHCRRNPEDTALSVFFQNFNATYAFSTDLGWIGTYYREYERLMAHWKESLDLPILDVDYEALVADPEVHIARMMSFMDLPLEPACFAPHENRRVVHTASCHQVRKPIYSSSVGRSERYGEWLTPLRAALKR